MESLGRLEKVEIRSVWQVESRDFTPWLANTENLSLLSDTIGIDLEFSSIEKDVGPFRADILCKNTIDGSWVLIENQLERTDHIHLGQLLTYAAGLDAVTIIWVASRFTEEHRAALDWLNHITNEKFNFFGLEVELWRIGDSDIAPKFNVISKPNDWTRTLQESARTASEVSDLKQSQLEFWQFFKKYMEEKQSFIRCQKPYPSHWTNHSIGRTGFTLSSVVSSWNSEENVWSPEVRAEFVIKTDDAKDIFTALKSQKDEIEKQFGKELSWHNQPGKKSCKIYVRKAADFTDIGSRPEQFEWLRQNLENLHRTFSPRIANLSVINSTIT